MSSQSRRPAECSHDLAHGVRHPRRWLLHAGRPAAQRVLRRRWDVRLHHSDRVPESGPVIFASNHIGWMDGPALAILAPRPVHALTKEEMFRGALGRFLLASGQIPLDRFEADPSAIRTCARVLADGGAVGIYPEGTRGPGDLRRFHHGAAYLALVSGAPVVPVSVFGTRLPGASSGSIPPKGSRMDLVFGHHWQVPAMPWPRRTSALLETSAALLGHMRDELQRAHDVAGQTLPGPLPHGQADADPDTGFNTDLEQ